MTSKKGGGATVTISKPAMAIALKYGENVSKGIQEMEKLILEYRLNALKNQVTVCDTIIGSNGGVNK